MARQTINLDFKANISQAKESIVSLAQAYRQALESGDPGQRDQVQKLIQERSAAMAPGGFDVDAISAQLEKSIALQKEFESSEIKINELKQASLRVEEEARQIQRDKKVLLEEAAQILGKEGGIKITELRQEFALIQKNNEELQKKGKLTEEDRKKAKDLFNILQGYDGQLDRQNNKNKEAKKIEEDKTALLKEQRVRTEQIAKVLETLAVDEESRLQVMAELIRFHIETEESLKRSTKAAEQLTQESVKIKKEQKEVSDTIASAKDSFAGKAVAAFIYYQALTALRRVARAAVSTLKELDKALTDIAVVTSMSREESFQLLGTYQDMAKQVGLTTTEVANLSIEFFRQGRSARDALQLTETAAKFAKIAAIDVKDAANFLTAAVNGFNLAASEAGRITDRFAALGAGAAASAAEIAIALSKVAPAAASAGVEIDNLMAFVTKGIETTREAPENIGTAFKTIFARMRQLTDIGKVMEDGMDVNRVDAALASVGVSLRDANGQFRNLDQVLIDLGGKWDTLDRNSQAYLATTLAGTRQQTRLIALFENFDRTLELIEISQESAGVATIQHTEFMSGMETATKRLQTTFQELITSFVNSEQIIFVINALNSGLGLLNTFVGRTIIVMAGLAAVISSVVREKGKLHFIMKAIAVVQKKQLLTSFTSYGEALGLVTTKIKALRTAITGKIAGQKLSTAQTNKSALATFKEAKAELLAAKAKKVTKASTLKLAAAKKTATIATLGLTKAILFSPLVIMVAIAAAGFLIGKAFKALQSPTKKAAERFEGLQDNIGKLNEKIRNLDSESRKLKKTLDEFKTLSNLRFLSPQEADRLQELELQLQLDLESNLTGDALIDVANRQLERVSKDLQAATLERQAEIGAFFRKNPLADFDELKTSDLLSDEAKENLEKVATDYATSLIEGFDQMTPEVQEAIRRMISADAAGFINEAENTGRAETDTEISLGRRLVFRSAGSGAGGLVWEEGEKIAVRAGENEAEAYARALEEGLVSGFARGRFNVAFREQVETKAITDPVIAAGAEIAAAYDSIGTVGFASGAATIQESFNALTEGMNPEQIEAALETLSDAVPSIRGFVSLTTDQIARLGAAGGTGALREFNVFDRLAQDIFKDASGNFDEVAGGEFLDDILNRLISANPEQRAAVGTQMMSEIIAGLTNIPPSERARVMNAIQDLIIPENMDSLLAGAFSAGDAFERATGLMGSGGAIKKEDLDFLVERFPDSVGEILNGTADLNALQEQYNAGLLKEIEDRRNALMLVLQTRIAAGDISELEKQQIGNSILQLDAAERNLTMQRETTDAIKERFDQERSALQLQRQAIDEAKKLRDLEQKAEEASALSTQATRIGAVGTLEARFNQAQLETQITQMNRDLEERIQIAKIEAQDRILADTQNKQLLEAQKDSISVMRTLTQVIQDATDSPQRRIPGLGAGGGGGEGGDPGNLPTLADQ